ncbi:hypothetical protein KJ786_01015 [Patescibacteria group bacterium]|nr:hypothetical protein [Patescibacteria group bacterium]
MKKDLRKLREGEALKERDRIVKMKMPEEEKLEKEKQEIIEKEKLAKETELRSAVLKKQFANEEDTMKQLKGYAQEQEKQQIFYLESEKITLEEQLKTLQKERGSSLLLKKNEFLLKRNEVENRLNHILEQEKAIENEEKVVSENEGTATAPSDRQKLEKKRQSLEEQRTELEKRKWVIEKEMEAILNKTKDIGDQEQGVLINQRALKDKIEENNNSLRAIYTKIMQREENKKSEKETQKNLETAGRAKEESLLKEKIQRQEWVQKEKPDDRGFLGNIPETAKEKLVEKLQQSADKEKKEREEFLKNIEERAKEDK